MIIDMPRHQEGEYLCAEIKKLIDKRIKGVSFYANDEIRGTAEFILSFNAGCVLNITIRSAGRYMSTQEAAASLLNYAERRILEYYFK